MSNASRTLIAGAGLLAAIALLLALVLTGRPPPKVNFDRFEAGGLFTFDPQQVTRVTLELGGHPITLTRIGENSWSLADGTEVDERESEHLRLGLRFLTVTKPSRVLAEGAVSEADRKAFGLTAPATRVTLFDGERELGQISFGDPTPAGTDRYAAVAGQPQIYMMPPHLPAEWEALGHLEAEQKAGASQ